MEASLLAVESRQTCNVTHVVRKYTAGFLAKGVDETPETLKIVRFLDEIATGDRKVVAAVAGSLAKMCLSGDCQ